MAGISSVMIEVRNLEREPSTQPQGQVYEPSAGEGRVPRGKGCEAVVKHSLIGLSADAGSDEGGCFAVDIGAKSAHHKACHAREVGVTAGEEIRSRFSDHVFQTGCDEEGACQSSAEANEPGMDFPEGL